MLKQKLQEKILVERPRTEKLNKEYGNVKVDEVTIGQIIGGMLLEDRLDGGNFTGDEVELLETMANHAIVAIENAWLYETVKNNYFGTVQSLINALEANDKYTRGHSERVRFMSCELGRFIGLDHRELEVLEHAAILHDIGKIGIDSAVLNKPGRLTNAEFSLIKTHPVISDEILGPIGTLDGVRTTVLQHHERYDGKGYPYGIAGEEISLKARVLAVVDAFDAMLAARPYRNALPFGKAMEEIKACAGTQFDPFIVRAFIEMIETAPDILVQGGYSAN
ncbi:MAG: HD domain-containing protein [Desulfatitalea sp.]|nr:HD domain-containing protein [Desulfatitalea sp.]